MSSIPTREEALFAEALAQPQSERGAFLAKACGGELDLLAHLVALVAAHEGPESLLVPSNPARAAPALSEKAGDWIGRYRLLQKIGEGGCGVVWMAEQQEPVRRRVALKVIKLGMDTKAVIARFEAERQALAMMDHPNIARVLDGGATEAGRPYFVMELVRGIPITTFCDENQLAPVERLELFIKACHAVQHAHQKGVIHRDLKPSNILVTVNDGAATPKVIDFGIAKATQGRLTDATVFTAFEQFIGTPVYMSPEQAQMSSLDIDTRSDIYSLGVLLYELLTGRPPFDAKAFARAGVDEIRHQIRETEPPKPSRRLHTLADAERITVARLRNIAPAQLSLLLRGDLDWIVMRCLEKNRTRRYDTANGLAMDIQRHLRNEPVIARPPSTAYLLQKLIRRHRLGFSAAAAIFMVLTIGVAVSAWQAVRATAAEHEQSRLRQAAESAQAREATQRQTAEQAQTREENLRRSAQAEELAARRKAYASDMNGVQQALSVDNLGRAQMLLDRQRPQPGQMDLRDWEWRYLWQFCRSDAKSVLYEKKERGAFIASVAVSADEKWLAVGESDNVAVWNLETETKDEISVPAGQGAIRVSFSPRESLLAITAAGTDASSGGLGNRILLWNARTRQIVRELPLGQPATGVIFSHDGQTVATLSAGQIGQICLWRVSDGVKLTEYPVGQIHPENRYSRFAVTGDMKLAAYSSFLGGKIHVLDLSTGRERWSAVASEEEVLALAFSPDGKMLASGAGWAKRDIRLWNASSGEEQGRIEGHRYGVTQLLFWPDGKRLASASGDQTVRVWDVSQRKLLRTFRGHTDQIYCLALLPDNKTLVSGSKDGAVLFWDTTGNREAVAAFTEWPGIALWRFTDGGEAIVTLDWLGRVVQRSGRNFRDETRLMEIAPQVPNSEPVQLDALINDRAIFARDVPLLAVGSANGRVEVWDWEQRKRVRELAVGDGAVSAVGFLGKGVRLMIESGADGILALREWELSAGRETRSWAMPGSAHIVQSVSPDEKEVVALDRSGNVHWRINLVTGRATALDLNLRVASQGGFSPDGSLFVAPSRAGYARVLEAATFRELTTLTGSVPAYHSAGFSPNGRRLVTGGSGSSSIMLFDVGSYEQVLALSTEKAAFFHSAFSPDGNVIGATSGAGAGALNLWRAPSWAEIEKADAAAAKSPRQSATAHARPM